MSTRPPVKTSSPARADAARTDSGASAQRSAVAASTGSPSTDKQRPPSAAGSASRPAPVATGAAAATTGASTGSPGQSARAGKSDEFQNLRDRVAALREKSQTFAKRGTELREYLNKMHDPKAKAAAKTEAQPVGDLKKKTGPASPSSTTMNYAALTPEDRETMKNILEIQSWLLTIKRQRNFGMFRDVLGDIMKTIFTPAQSKQNRRTATSGTFKGGMLPTAQAHHEADDSAKKEDLMELDFDDDDQDELGDKFEQLAQTKKTMPLEPQHPKNVQFKNGMWVRVSSDDGADEDAGFDESDDDEPAAKSHVSGAAASTSLDDESYPDEIELSDEEMDGKSDKLSRTSTRSKSLDIDDDEDLEAPSSPVSTTSTGSRKGHTRSHSSGPAARELNEFDLNDDFMAYVLSSQKNHELMYTGCFVPDSHALALLSTQDSINNKLQMDWLLYQAEVMQAHMVEAHANSDSSRDTKDGKRAHH